MAPSPASVFHRLHERPGSVWLDGGNREDPEFGQWSILAWDPVDSTTEVTDWPDAGRRLTAGPPTDATVPFGGGCIGYIGYGAASAVGPFPSGEPSWEPPVWLARYEGALCFRHHDRTWHASGTASFRNKARRLLSSVQPLPPICPRPDTARAHTIPAEDYQQAVARIRELLLHGDCYQVNLTREVRVEEAGAPWPAYRRLRRHSNAAFGTYLVLDDAIRVLSNSPELFVDLTRSHITTLPVKGTAPRGADPAEDTKLRDSLVMSGKDRAELTMIVDLYRNDLGRLAVPGSIQTGPRHVISHANVHHARQRVTATLPSTDDIWDLLAYTFPPGSVTGAPKRRACERIAEIEQTPRGVYCGIIGYASPSGHARWSVAIRTAVWRGTTARYHVGGGVVIDSTPQGEWEETEHKASALASAIGGLSDQ